MNWRRRWIFIISFGMGLLVTPHVFGSVIIAEFLADPPGTPSGDANGDGVVSASQDEFIEFLNAGADGADLSGWSIADAVRVRHVFPSGTIIPGWNFLVVFGGGVPSLPGTTSQVASSGTLSFNNAADTISLFNSAGTVVSSVIYGDEAGRDQSLVRFPEGIADSFSLHAGLPQAQGALFSPGKPVAGTLLSDSIPVASVPEPGTLFSLGLGVLGLLRARKSNAL